MKKTVKAKVVKIKIAGKTQQLNEAALRALPRKTQIAAAVALGVKLHRGVSKNGIVNLILAN